MRKLFVILALAALAVSCNPSEPEEQLAATPAAAAPGTDECEDRDPPAPAADGLKNTKKAPDVDVPEGAPPCELVIHDIVEGDGDEVEEDATVTFNYTGVAWSTGDEFDTSWDDGQPLTYALSGLIPGWQEGIPGMKEGGRRQLVIPPALAYGDQGSQDGSVRPGETLIFIIDLIKTAN